MHSDWNQILRPRSWDTVLGQNHIKGIIRQAIAGGNFPRFSIYAGPSGMGKSCLAELSAMTLCCESSTENPCMTCRSCRSFLENQSYAIRKFNMARLLGKKDIIGVLADIFDYESMAPKSVYILEEVHALKDSEQMPFLEELTKIPDNVHVIMCTTQPYKLLNEIRNRAVIFTLEPPSTSECIEYLQSICYRMGIPTPTKTTLKLFVDLCDNTPRKIVSTLQLFANTTNISQEDLVKFFGLAEDEVYVDLLDMLLTEHSMTEYAEYLSNLDDDGISSIKIVKGLERFLTTVLLERSGRKQFKSFKDKERLTYISRKLGESNLLKIIEAVADMDRKTYASESSAKFFLVRLKLLLLNREQSIIANNAKESMETTLFSEEKSRKLDTSDTQSNGSLEDVTSAVSLSDLLMQSEGGYYEEEGET